MKIGILTHHYVKNFGAYMQAYALVQTIKEIEPAAQVELIDYRVSKHALLTAVHFFGFKPQRGDTLSGYFGKVGLFFTHSKFEKSLPKSKRVYSADDINDLQYNLIVVGADEVWNISDIAFDPIKCGYGLRAPLISYSASAGGTSIKDSVPDSVRNGLLHFKAIAVRDDNTEGLVKTIVGNKVKIARTLDPVFLWDYKLIVRDRIKQLTVRPYILIYDCHVTDQQATKLVKYAQSHNMNIIGAGEYRKWYTKHADNITPFEWAYLFKNAWGIVTGTFHGTAFSIKYNRNFVAFLTESNRINKVTSLLEEFDLSDRVVKKENSGDLISVLEKEIDYSSVNKIIFEKKAISVQYLKDQITGTVGGCERI